MVTSRASSQLKVSVEIAQASGGQNGAGGKITQIQVLPLEAHPENESVVAAERLCRAKCRVAQGIWAMR